MVRGECCGPVIGGQFMHRPVWGECPHLPLTRRTRPAEIAMLPPGAGFDAELVAFWVLHHGEAGIVADHGGT
jgi:hypothetical protein